MPLISFDLVKKHLRIFHNDEDTEIAAYQAAAESIVVEHLDREIVEDGATPEGDGIAVTPAITAAILLVVGDLFEAREPDPKAVGDAVLPKAVRALLAPWRVWRTLPEE